GTADQKAAVLPGLLSGEAVAAWTGPAPVTAAPGAEGGFVLAGTAAPVEAGAQAEHLLVLAEGPAGSTHLLVRRDAPGVTVTPLAGLDFVHRFAEVRFDDAAVPASAVVGEPGDAVAAA